MYAMGIDIGTTSISMVMLDEENGALVARETVNHASFIDDGCPVGKAQDVGRIISIVMEKYAALVSAHGRPCCIGLTGQMHGMLYVDKDGEAVSPLYTWQDGRGGAPLADGRSAAQVRARHQHMPVEGDREAGHAEDGAQQAQQRCALSYDGQHRKPSLQAANLGAAGGVHGLAQYARGTVAVADGRRHDARYRRGRVVA